MRPGAIRAAAFSRLICDHGLRAVRGVNRCRNIASSRPRFCPSIQPWQSARSTASA